MNDILIGDVLHKLKEIPDQYINTCVTSPPYWGLRDYGTADWKGGNPDCTHRKMAYTKDMKTPGGRGGSMPAQETIFKDKCGMCGAIRIDNQIGLEKTPEEYVDKMVQVFREVHRVLRDDGTLWLNLGDSYTNNSQPGSGDPTIKDRNIGQSKYTPTLVKGLKPKNLVGIPWRVAFALQADGWYLRQDIIWHKPNPMPESVKDRCTKAHEYIFLLSKSQNYYYDYEAIKEPQSDSTLKRFAEGQAQRKSIGPKGLSYGVNGGQSTGAIGILENGRNKRSVWTVSTKPFTGSHFATFPPELIEPCILAGSPRGGIVLDPFFGAGTTGIVSLKHGRNYIGIELNPEYAAMAANRIKHGTVDPEELEVIEREKQVELFT